MTLETFEERNFVEERKAYLRGFWAQRDLQWTEDRRLLAMQYKQRIPPYEMITSNEVAVLHSGSVAILAGKTPIFTLPISVQEQGERLKMDKAERFLQGVFREFDYRWRRKGHGPWLLAYFYYSCLGAVVAMPHIKKVKGKPPEFHCDLYDPLTVYPMFGEDGLLEVVRVYETSYDHAMSIVTSNGWDREWGLVAPPKKEYVEVVNHWDYGHKEEGEDPDIPYNTVSMAGKIVKRRTAHDEFRAIPMQVQPMNGVPWRGFNGPFNVAAAAPGALDASNWTTGWGRPIFWANRTIYRDIDRILSYKAERARRNSYGITLALTADGQVQFTQEDINKGGVVTLDVTKGESAQTLNPPPEPRELTELTTELFGMTQRAGLNRLALGDLNLEISGVTLERAIAAAKYVLQPYAEGGAQGLSDILMNFIEQARQLRLRKVTLQTRQQQMGADFGYQQEEFGREDIPEVTRVDVRLPMLIPDDRMRRATIARTLIPGNIPLSDMQSVAEEDLEVQDWTIMKQRMDEDFAENHPVMQNVKLRAAIARKIEDWKQLPGMEGAVQEGQLAIIALRKQFIQAAAPREQPASTLQGSEAEPRPEVQSAEGSAVSPTEAEMVMNQPSRPTNPNGRARIQSLMRGGG